MERAIAKIVEDEPGAESRVRSVLKYVPVEPSFFDLLPFSIVIYHVRGGQGPKAILLEPMAPAIGEDRFDGDTADAQKSADEAEPHPWEERTFDVRIGAYGVVEQLRRIFIKHWNLGIEAESSRLAETDAAAAAALEDEWLI